MVGLTEAGRAASRHDAPLPNWSKSISLNRQSASYCRSSLEDDGIITRARRVGKGAHSLGGFVIICHQEIIQTLVAEPFEEPLAAIDISLVTSTPSCTVYMDRYIHVRTGKLLERVEAKTRILH